MTATMTASWATTPTDAANLTTGVERVISTEADVDALLAELAAPLAEEAQFPAGSGLPVAKVAEALREFLRTSRKPDSVKWVPEKHRPRTFAESHRRRTPSPPHTLCDTHAGHATRAPATRKPARPSPSFSRLGDRSVW
jgi:hypothetical protein